VINRGRISTGNTNRHFFTSVVALPNVALQKPACNANFTLEVANESDRRVAFLVVLPEYGVFERHKVASHLAIHDK
jgi:hypothetical protein